LKQSQSKIYFTEYKAFIRTDEIISENFILIIAQKDKGAIFARSKAEVLKDILAR
jgi:hypothetical protein